MFGRRPLPEGLGAYLVAGVAVGGVYAALNTIFDRFDRSHRVFAGLLTLHVIVDQVLPVITGAVLGIAVFLWRTRSRAADLEAMRADELASRLRSAEREQAVWVVATAALHDVRNPLHTLGLLLDELAERAPTFAASLAASRARADGLPADGLPADGAPSGEGSDETGALIERSRAQVERIRGSIAEMRRLAAAARPEPVALALGDVVREVVASHEARTRGQAIEVSLSLEDLRVRADPLHLRIVVDALYTNALDALRGGGRVALALRRDEPASEPGHVVLLVSDDGAGIGPELRARVFEPLATTKAHGLGLGLSIARALARAMRGDLELAETDVDDPSEKTGYATTFRVRLPEAAA